MPNLALPTIRIRVGGVYVTDDKLLLVRHQKGVRSYWLLPGGGVEPGENMAEALEREVREECGVLTRTSRLLFVSEAISLAHARHHVNLTFLGNIHEGEPALCEQGPPLAEVAWLTRAQIAGVTLFPSFWRELQQAWDVGFSQLATYLGNIWRDE